MESRTYICTK